MSIVSKAQESTQAQDITEVKTSLKNKDLQHHLYNLTSENISKLIQPYFINAINDYIEKNKEYNFIKNQKTEEIKPPIDSAELISSYLMSNKTKQEKIKFIKDVFEHNKDRHLKPEELIETIIKHLSDSKVSHAKYFIKEMENLIVPNTTLDYTDLMQVIEKNPKKEIGFIKTPKTNPEQTSLIQLIEKYKQKDIEFIKTPRTDPKQNAK